MHRQKDVHGVPVPNVVQAKVHAAKVKLAHLYRHAIELSARKKQNVRGVRIAMVQHQSAPNQSHVMTRLNATMVRMAYRTFEMLKVVFYYYFRYTIVY